MSIPERSLVSEVAEDWIREILRQESQGARLTVSGTCMEPSLKEGSKITLRRFDGVVRVGDVVLLSTAAGLRLHRVLLRFGDRIRTKGDRGTYLDPSSPLSAVIGVCETNENRFTRLVRAAGNLGRVFARSWTASGRADGAHAGLLP